ncbi:MAG: hypothetical protein GY702_24375 [Desulfobulbaceae bacterium]|nr:hypothetical protein [Desulfobulbaceae bacterium]
MNEPRALDEQLRTLVMHSFEGGGERLPRFNKGVDDGSISVKPIILSLRWSCSTIAVPIPGATADQEKLIGCVEDPVPFLFG